jgi:glucose/arabinose dehydrogenase
MSFQDVSLFSGKYKRNKMENGKLFISLATILFLLHGNLDLKQPTAHNITQAHLYNLTEAFPRLTFDMPIELTSPEDGTDRIFVVEQNGIIQVFQNSPDVQKSTVFLDIDKQVHTGGEAGLLGMAFHPDYKTNGYFYLNYTVGDSKNLETIISRFKVSATNPNVADPKSETELLRFVQPWDNHNGGKVAFGNDGFLYIATGDGGSWGDPGNRAQNRKELLGKILRIDVNTSSASAKYGIPADNPYKGNKEKYREEVYAYGMRNPWRFCFDRVTGQLWAGDVGQNEFEEIDVIEKGGNYGWRIMEANKCYRTETCNKDQLKAPIFNYRQGPDTGQSITGGYVCRDKSLPSLTGKYIYGDFVTGNIWALTHANNKAVKNELIAKISGGLPSFGEDSKRNLYVLSYNPGKIYRLAQN